jgi:hypothetical protein
LFQGDIFGGLNDGLLSRAEALAAVDISKHQVSSNPGGLPQLKHDMMYHPGMQHPANSRSQVGDFKVSTATPNYYQVFCTWSSIIYIKKIY